MYERCIVCGRDMCLTCHATIAGSIVSSTPHTCRKCGDREDVIGIYEKWAPRIQKPCKARDEELAALGPKVYE